MRPVISVNRRSRKERNTRFSLWTQQQILGAQVCVVVWESDTERDMRPRQREGGENVERNSEFMTLVLHTICSLCSQVDVAKTASPLRLSEFALLPLRLGTADASCHAGAGHSFCFCFCFCACGPLMIRVLLLYSRFEHIQTFPRNFFFSGGLACTRIRGVRRVAFRLN